MTGEFSFFGIYVPLLLVLCMAALVINNFLTRLLSILGAYRLFNNRPIVDMSCFIVILGLLSWLFTTKGVS